jgi:TonB family protein
LDVSGIVRVKFSVREDGSLAKFSIQKSINKQVDDEAIRILKEGPNWMPRINDGVIRKQWIINDLTFN